MGELNLPFESDPGAAGGDPFHMDVEVLLSGGVVVQAVTVPTTAGGVLPALVFRFAKADGSGLLPPVLLACDDRADLMALVPLVRSAVAAALEAAPL